MKIKKNVNITRSLLILILGFVATFCYAGRVDLDKQSVTCGNYKLSSKTTASDVLKYCKVKKLEKQKYPTHDEQEIVFNARTTVKMKCEFAHDQVEKCKTD